MITYVLDENDAELVLDALAELGGEDTDVGRAYYALYQNLGNQFFAQLPNEGKPNSPNSQEMIAHAEHDRFQETD